MSASKEIKALGLPSLQYVADKSDTPRDTLHRWYHTHYPRFISIVRGVKEFYKCECCGINGFDVESCQDPLDDDVMLLICGSCHSELCEEA